MRAAALIAVLVAGWVLANAHGSPRPAAQIASRVFNPFASDRSRSTSGRQPRAHAGSRARRLPPFAIGERVLTFEDRSRLIRLPGRPPQPRRLVTVVRYPEHAVGPFPLVVFGHGFAVTPAYYYRLLRAWAQAGYVVAAPVFPLGNAHAPGGPVEADIVNQPRDMSFVITRLLAATGPGPSAGSTARIDRPMAAPSDLMRYRVLPALIAALGVSFLVAGLLSYTTGSPFDTDPTPAATDLVSASPTGTPAPSPSPSPSPDGSGSPSEPVGPVQHRTIGAAHGFGPAVRFGPRVGLALGVPAADGPDPTPTPSNRVATRVVIPALQIDLPVVKPPGNSSTYPLCNVAQFIQSLSQPGLPGATYLYAHAREGMFLPILEASLVNNGKSMIGMLVQVYTSDNRYYLYQVTEVRRHQLTLNDAIAAKDQELWLQTSEGPKGTPGKTQLIALPLSDGPADPADAHPTPHPVVCG